MTNYHKHRGLNSKFIVWQFCRMKIQAAWQMLLLLPFHDWNQSVSRAVLLAGGCGASSRRLLVAVGRIQYQVLATSRPPPILLAFAWRSFLASREHLNSLTRDSLHPQSQCQIPLRLLISLTFHSASAEKNSLFLCAHLIWPGLSG